MIAPPAKSCIVRFSPLAFTCIAGLATGVSELNPELTEELARLRRQNEQLAAKVCAFGHGADPGTDTDRGNNIVDIDFYIDSDNDVDNRYYIDNFDVHVDANIDIISNIYIDIDVAILSLIHI